MAKSVNYIISVKEICAKPRVYLGDTYCDINNNNQIKIMVFTNYLA